MMFDNCLVKITIIFNLYLKYLTCCFQSLQCCKQIRLGTWQICHIVDVNDFR